MSRAAGICAIVAATVVVVAGCGGGGSSGSNGVRSDYVKGNTSVLDTLPAYPKATLTKTASTAYTTGKKSVSGYQTRYIYSLPATATTAKVEAFYLKSLAGGWTQVASLTGPVLNYRKGDAFVSLNLTRVHTHTLEIVVDKSFFAHLAKG